MYFYIENKRVSSKVIIQELLKRDGNRCTFPGCKEPFGEENLSITIDHTYPQVRAREDGWDETSIHGIDNLALMHRKCNTKKGEYIYNDDGTLSIPARAAKLPKAKRPDQCKECNSGRLIYPGDKCEVCGIGAQPTTAPGVFQKHFSKCPHKGDFHCAYCFAYHPELRESK